QDHLPRQLPALHLDFLVALTALGVILHLLLGHAQVPLMPPLLPHPVHRRHANVYTMLAAAAKFAGKSMSPSDRITVNCPCTYDHAISAISVVFNKFISNCMPLRPATRRPNPCKGFSFARLGISGLVEM